MSIRQIILFFITYKYIAIFPVAVAEGPIISLISGFLISRGQLDLFLTLVIVVLGDLISDVAFYMIGRGGRRALPYIKFLHIPEERLQKIEDQYRTHPWKTMIVAKAAYGLGSIFMVASGAARVSWKKFLLYVITLDFLRSTVLLCLGYYFGKSVVRFGPTYLWYYTVAVLVLLPASYLVFRKKYILKRTYR